MEVNKGESKLRMRFCWGPLTISVTSGILSRLIYLLVTREFVGQDNPRVLDWQPAFTQIDIINMQLPLWALYLILPAILILLFVDMTLAKDFSKDVIVRWLIAYLIFLLNFYLWVWINYKLDDKFDPSGQLTAILVN